MLAMVGLLNDLGRWLAVNLGRMSLELTILAGIVLAALYVLRVKSPAARHLFLGLLLAKPVVTLLVASPLSLYGFLWPPTPEFIAAPSVVSVTAALPPVEYTERMAPAANESPAPVAAAPGPPFWSQLDRYGILSVAWTLIAGALGIRLLLGCAYVALLRSTAHREHDGPLSRAVAAASRTLRLRRHVHIATTRVAHGPVLAGIFRPVILLPETMTAALSPEQLKLVVTHELAHARRWDNLVLLVQRLAEMFLFFHPVVWLCGWMMRREAEAACDDAVVSAYGEADAAVAYAESLTRVAEMKCGITRRLLVNTFAAAESNFNRRIRRILSGRRTRMTLWFSVATGAVLVVIGALGLPTALSSSRDAANEDATKTLVLAPDAKLLDEPVRQAWQAEGLVSEERIKERLQTETISVIEKRVQAAGMPECVFVKLPGGAIRVELSKAADNSQIAAVESFATTPGHLCFHGVAGGDILSAALESLGKDETLGKPFLALLDIPKDRGREAAFFENHSGEAWPFIHGINAAPDLLPEGMEFAAGPDFGGVGELRRELLLIEREAALKNVHLKSAIASPSQDTRGSYHVVAALSPEDAARFGDFTQANIGHRIACVLDHVIWCAPVVRDRITGAVSLPVMSAAAKEQAETYAAILASGPLPAPVTIIGTDEPETTEDGVPHRLESRRLLFPADVRVGEIYTRPAEEPFYAPFDPSGGMEHWEHFAEARGTVEIPAGVQIMLEVSEARLLQHLDQIPPDALQCLSLRGTDLHDGDLAHVARLTGLRALDCEHNAALTDRGLVQLAAMKQLETLKLGLSNVSLAHGEPLLELGKLWYLDVNHCPLSNRALEVISRIPTLRWINLEETNVSAAGLAQLTACSGLEGLSLCDCTVDRSPVQAVAALTGLRYLNLCNEMHVADEDLPLLAGLMHLQFLSLRKNSGVTDYGVPRLTDLKNLRYLDLRETGITGQALAALAQMPNLSEVLSAFSQIDAHQADSFTGGQSASATVPRQTSPDPNALKVGLFMSHFTATGPSWRGEPYGYEHQFSEEFATVLDLMNFDVYAVIEPGTADKGALPRILSKTGLRDKTIEVTNLPALLGLDVIVIKKCNNAIPEMAGLLRQAVEHGVGLVDIGGFGRVTPGYNAEFEDVYGLPQTGYSYYMDVIDAPVLQQHPILGGLKPGDTIAIDVPDGFTIPDGSVRDGAVLLGGTDKLDKGFVTLMVHELGKGRIVVGNWYYLTIPRCPWGPYGLYLRCINWAAHRPLDTGHAAESSPAASASDEARDDKSAQNASAVASASHGDASAPWRAAFDQVYSLKEGEVLKRIAPPFIPERMERYLAEMPGQAASMPQGPRYMAMTWDKGRVLRTVESYGCFPESPVILGEVLLSLTDLSSDRLDIPDGLLTIGVPGDWVVRDGAETQTILKELARILHEELNCDLEFAKEDREREVIVASGAYAFTPVPDVEGNEQIHLFADVFDLNSGAGGSVGTTIPEFLRTLKDRIGQRIIDETTPTSEKTKNICFHPIQSLNEARAKAVTEKDEKDLERLRDLFLANVTKQTGLQFSIERRTVPVWTIAGDRATVRLPAKNMAQVSSEPPAPAKPDAPPPDAFALKCDAQVVDPFALAVTPSSPRNRFQGQVVGEDGKPLAGVLVNAWTWCPGNEATTDADGVFSLDDFDADQKAIEVRFSKEGYSPVYMFRQPLGRLAQPLAMTTRTYLDGKVVDSQGRPVPNAIIRVDGGPRQAEGVMLTDTMTQTTARPDGAYRIYVQHGVYQVTATDGREMAVMSNVIVAKDEAKPLDIQLSPAPVFRAKVVDSITGAPVEGLRLFSWRLKEYEGTSNADGEIVISGMPTGKFRFDVDAEKRDITRWWSEEAADKSQRYGIDDEKTKWQRNFDDLAFDLEKDMTPVTITLEKGVRICGTVVDPDGKPVEGATVSAARTGTSNSLTGDTRFSVRSDKDGNFDLLLPASKSAQYNLICHDGDFQEWRTWANGAAAPMTTQPGDVKEGVVLQLQRPCIMRGKVVDDQGSPIVDREVRACAFDKNDNRYYVPESRTDKDGIFELKYVAPGKHFVQAAPFWLDPEKAPEGTSQIIEITQEKPVEGIVLKSTPETGVASTTATETDGKPSSVADATSPAPPADGTPGATGGNEDNAAQQTNRGKITGVVTGPDGQPIAGAYVGVGDFGDSGGSNHDRHRQEGLYANAKTDDQGRFTLDGLAFSDAHPLFVTHPDYIRHDQQITLSESQPSVTIGCQLEPAARINVTVVDSAGAPAPGQYLFRLKDAQGFRRIPPGMDPHLSTFASTAWTRGPREGAFSFTELPAGDYLIDVICAAPAPERVSGGNRRVLDDKTTAYYGGSAASPVKAGQIWDLEITPQEHGTRLVCTMPANDPSSPGFLRIFAIGRSSELPFEAKAKIRSLEDPKLGRIAEGALFHTLMKTDSFTVANLPPGEYTIFAGPILELDGARVQLAPGQDVMVDLPVKPGASEQSSAQPRYDKINPRGGAVVDGLQVVLRTEKERWALGERPEMIADFLVVGEGATWMEDLPLGVQFECDGVQYAARAAGRPSAPALFGRGSLYDFRGLLDSELVDSKDQALTLTPGRHTIRLAIPSVILKGPESARSLVFSNPVSIVIG